MTDCYGNDYVSVFYGIIVSYYLTSIGGSYFY